MRFCACAFVYVCVCICVCEVGHRIFGDKKVLKGAVGWGSEGIVGHVFVSWYLLVDAHEDKGPGRAAFFHHGFIQYMCSGDLNCNNRLEEEKTLRRMGGLPSGGRYGTMFTCLFVSLLYAGCGHWCVVKHM